MQDNGGGSGGRRSLSYEFSREPNGSTPGVTLGGILSIKEPSSFRIQKRTLLDLIRDDPTCGNDSKKMWKMFREKLRLKLAGSVCTTAVPILASHVHIITGNSRTMTENGTNRLNSPPVSNTSSLTVTSSTNRLNSPPVSDTSSVTVTSSTNRLNSPPVSNSGNIPVTQTANCTNRINSPSVTNTGSIPDTQTNRSTSPVRNSGSVPVTHTANCTNLSHLLRNTSSVPDTQPANSTNLLNFPPVSHTNTGTVPATQTLNVRSEPPVEENRHGGDGGGPAPVKMSLMSLLEVDGSAYFDDDEEEMVEEVAAEGGGDGAGGGDGGGDGGGGSYRYNNCCVCMVRHKGAAFIPCGHTFCRVCSREIFVNRASCPLCNNYISKILDIF